VRNLRILKQKETEMETVKSALMKKESELTKLTNNREKDLVTILSEFEMERS
jgi:hypothetical protein